METIILYGWILLKIQLMKFWIGRFCGLEKGRWRNRASQKTPVALASITNTIARMTKKMSSNTKPLHALIKLVYRQWYWTFSRTVPLWDTISITVTQESCWVPTERLGSPICVLLVSFCGCMMYEMNKTESKIITNTSQYYSPIETLTFFGQSTAMIHMFTTQKLFLIFLLEYQETK